MKDDRDSAGNNSQNEDHPGKVFLVLANSSVRWQRQCLVCDAVFDSPQATAAHAQSICFPAKAHTSN